MPLSARLTALATRMSLEVRAVRLIAEAALTEVPEATTSVIGGVKLDPALSSMVDLASDLYSYTTITTTGAPGEVPSVPALGLFITLLNQWSDGVIGPDEYTKIDRTALEASAQVALLLAETALQNLTECDAWEATTAYNKGDIVTSQYSRWYCKTAHTSAATWAETNWMHLGLYAVGATSDPGVPGRLWIDVT